MLKDTQAQKILFQVEYPLKWRDLPQIRSSLSRMLAASAVARQQADPMIIIISELVENAFKCSDNKRVTILLKQIFEPPLRIEIKVHHSVSNFKSALLKIFLHDIARVNVANDIDRLYLETLREAVLFNTKANRFRLALIRKTAQGAPLRIRKSMIYQPGISIGIDYILPH